MEEHDQVDWRAVLRDDNEDGLRDRGSRNLVQAVVTSEGLSSTIDHDEVATTNTAETIRAFRDTRCGDEES